MFFTTKRWKFSISVKIQVPSETLIQFHDYIIYLVSVSSTIESQELQTILVVFSDCEFTDDTLAFWTQIFVYKQRSIKSTGI